MTRPRRLVGAAAEVRRAHHARTGGDERLHATDRPMTSDFGLEQPVDLGVLVVVFDLPAAFLDADVGAAATTTEPRPAAAQRQIAGRRRAGIEVLVEAGIGRHHYHATRLPIALARLLVLLPEQREAVAGEDHQMR